MVVLPLGAILDWTMGTPAAFAAFRGRRINTMLKKVLSVWCEFLSSGDSRYVLNDSSSGWKGEAARRAIDRAGPLSGKAPPAAARPALSPGASPL